MRLPSIAIQNYRFTLTAFILLIIFGFNAFFHMPRTEDPTVFIPGGSVIVIYPGTDPKDLEQLVALPIEEAINELDDIETVTTELKDGIAVISVEFSYHTDAKEKFNELVQKVNSIRNKLPEEILSLNYMEWSSTDVAIMQLALVSEKASFSRMREQTDRLKRNIEKIKGVKRVEIYGLPDEEVRVIPDPGKMARMNISIDQVLNALKSNNANIPGGKIVLDGKNFMVKTGGGYKTPEDIKNTVVQSFRGRIIRLGQVADVLFEQKDPDYFARFDGDRSLFITVKQKEGVNIFDITGELKPLLTDFRHKLAPDTKLLYVFDQSEGVNHKINGFLNNLLQGIVLVGLIVLLALGLKSSLIVILAIPFSILIGLGFVDLSGYGLQQISIAALVVALGLLVDNSIVMVENIDRFVSLGHPPKEAAAKGASQIAWPVVTATLTTLLAFIPIILMPDKAGDFIRSLPVTILATLTISLLIALTVNPLLAAYLFKLPSGKAGRRKGRLFRLRLERFVTGPYRKSLQFSLRKKGLIILLAVLLFLGSLALFPLVGLSFFPPAQTPELMVRLEAPYGTGIEKTNRMTKKVEAVLDTLSGVVHYATNVGHGNPRIYYNILTRSYAPNYAEIYVRLKKYEEKSYENVVSALRNRFRDFPGARITVKEYQQGVPVTAPVMIYILGENLPALQNISTTVEETLKETPGLININNRLKQSKTSLIFSINKDKAAMLGVPVAEIEKTIRTALNGIAATSFRDREGKEYDITLRFFGDKKSTIRALDLVYVHSVSGKFIPLRQLGTWKVEESPAIISRYNMQRTGLITADLEKGASLDEAMRPILEKLTTIHFPPGFDYHVGGELENRQETFGGMTRAGIIAVIAIFAVLVLQFNSFKQPFIIFVTLPLAGIGSIWALYIAGYTFSFTAFIGLVSLIGIVVNNAIILVDYTNILIRKGHTLKDAVQEAGETRFTPILLTTLTTIGGLLPLTLRGGELWAPLGWTIIGGLLVSTILTLIMVPVLYTLLTGNKR